MDRLPNISIDEYDYLRTKGLMQFLQRCYSRIRHIAVRYRFSNLFYSRSLEVEQIPLCIIYE